MTDHTGVLQELVDGTWREPGSNTQYDIGIKNIVIRESLEGQEAQLIADLYQNKKITIVSDPFTHAAYGQRIFNALTKDNSNQVSEFVWQTAQCSDRGVAEVQAATKDAEVLIAVGSGTINDSVKYACFLDDKPYSVFATSPMNAFTTGTASVSFGGFKKSISCRGAEGIFFDLAILSACPPRLISAAFADVICRTTAQVDWLMSHILFDTFYTQTPYTLLAYDEPDMIANAERMLSGDTKALGMLTRISAIMGLGTRFNNTTHSGSMAEHQISHYIDMFAGDKHPKSSHGEQVGVATITMSHLHNHVLTNATPPVMKATHIPESYLLEKFGSDIGNNMIEQTKIKALTDASADALNQRFADEWDSIRTQLQAAMLPYDQLSSAMAAAGCQLTATDLELDTDFYLEAVQGARFIRDRFSMLDVIDDSVGLASVTDSLPL